MSNVHSEEHSEQVRVRFEKLAQIWAREENPYKNGIVPSDLASRLHQKYSERSKEDLEVLAQPCSVAGRVMAIRDFGKASFVRLQDRSGQIQLFIQKDRIGPEAYAQFKEWDIGDILFAQGTVFKTKTGELSVFCDQVQLATKSLRPLPEKFHGIADVEIKYRQRYLDLIVTELTRETFRKRSRIVSEIRKFFEDEDFMEVETPMMHPIAGGATARPFTTHHNALDMTLYMRIAPELYLKRLVVGGFERVFEINRNFRNEGISIKHNPEFTMLEFYQSYATFEDLMSLHERLFQKLAERLNGSTRITYQGTEIELGGSWQRITVEEALVRYTDFKDPALLRNREALLSYGKQKRLPMDPKDTVGGLMMAIFDHEVEAQLIQPTFVTHHPLDISPLSRKNEKDPFLVDRFELYIYGREMANAFSELNDPVDQMRRFEAQVKAREAGNEEATDMDLDYVTALEYGMPPTAGAGIGIDRLTMLLTDSASIRDVILFPLMRPVQVGDLKSDSSAPQNSAASKE
jgi:lysyl-tRNA synthetase class 2